MVSGVQLDHQAGHGATQGGPFQPLGLEQALRGAAAGSPTLALPQPAEWWPRTKLPTASASCPPHWARWWFLQGIKAPRVKGWGVLPRQLWAHPRDRSHPTVTLQGLWMQNCSAKMLRARVGALCLFRGGSVQCGANETCPDAL